MLPYLEAIIFASRNEKAEKNPASASHSGKSAALCLEAINL
jgi:hypothetical protein